MTVLQFSIAICVCFVLLGLLISRFDSRGDE